MKSRGPESLRGLAPGPTGPGVCLEYALPGPLKARLDVLGPGSLRMRRTRRRQSECRRCIPEGSADPALVETLVRFVALAKEQAG